MSFKENALSQHRPTIGVGSPFIDRLSNEELYSIFAILIRPEENFVDAWISNDWGLNNTHQLEVISLVCRRFQDVIVSVAEFWTNLVSSQDKETVDLHIKRSKGMQLDVTIIGKSVSHSRIEQATLFSNFDVFIRTVVAEKQRWRSFVLRPLAPHQHQLQEIVSAYAKQAHSVIRKWTHDAVFSNLQYLHVDFLGWEDLGEFEDDIMLDNHLFEFYHSWSMPMLNTFYFKNHNFRSPVENVTTGILDMSQKRTDYALIFEFLQQHRNLQRLTLMGLSVDVEEGPLLALEDILQSKRKLVLPALKEINFGRFKTLTI